MIAYAYDNNGFYIGNVILQESPLEKGVFGDIPNTTKTPIPQANENEIGYWNGSNWEVKPNYSGKTYYSKIDKSEKNFEKGESFDSNYTEVSPLENERFQKWDEDSNSWIIDEVAKNNFELKVRQSIIQRLLLESDYIELPSFLERKGQETYNLWMIYRADLRAAYHNVTLSIPQKPE